MSDKRFLSRSETVRRRRQVARSQPRKKSGSRKELPPITARGVINDLALDHRMKSRKRRFNAMLNVPGLQDRSLSLPQFQVQVGWRLLSFILSLLLGGCLYLAWSLPYFRVTSAIVTGNQRIPAEEVNAVLGLGGRPIFVLNPRSIESHALQNYTELASVDVTVSLPNVVTVNIVERQPVIMWQQDGSYTWIDENGVAFRPRGEAPGLVVVQALTAPPIQDGSAGHSDGVVPFISQDLTSAILALAPDVPGGIPIVYDQLSGLGWNDPRGWRVVFGNNLDDIALKVRVYQTLVAWLSERGIQPVLINVAYPGAPFYRLGQLEQ